MKSRPYLYPKDRVAIRVDEILRASNMHLSQSLPDYSRPNEYKKFLRECASHAEIVGDIRVEEALMREFLSWSEVRDGIDKGIENLYDKRS